MSIILFLLIAGTTISYAQINDNIIKTPHGGVIQNADDYKIEMVERENNLSFYVLDSKGRTISNKGVTGTVVFEFFNKTKASNPISLDINNALFADVPKANVYTYCTISVIVKGKTISAKYRNSQVSEQDINHGHQH